MADSPVEGAAATGGGCQPATPCFKLFGTRIVTETTTTINNPTKENERTSESGTSSPEKPTTPTSAAATATAAATAATATGLACPRCKSRETKFCYFNNYNVNQPRHFCRGCHRYWTAGGALRNVPVGAGRRKAARPPSHAEGGGVFGFSTGLDGVVVQQWLMSHDGFPAKRPNISSFHDRIR